MKYMVLLYGEADAGILVDSSPLQPQAATTARVRDAIALEPADAIRQHITGQIAVLGAANEPSEET